MDFLVVEEVDLPFGAAEKRLGKSGEIAEAVIPISDTFKAGTVLGKAGKEASQTAEHPGKEFCQFRIVPHLIDRRYAATAGTDCRPVVRSRLPPELLVKAVENAHPDLSFDPCDHDRSEEIADEGKDLRHRLARLRSKEVDDLRVRLHAGQSRVAKVCGECPCIFVAHRPKNIFQCGDVLGLTIQPCENTECLQFSAAGKVSVFVEFIRGAVTVRLKSLEKRERNGDRRRVADLVRQSDGVCKKCRKIRIAKDPLPVFFGIRRALGARAFKDFEKFFFRVIFHFVNAPFFVGIGIGNGDFRALRYAGVFADAPRCTAKSENRTDVIRRRIF